MIEKENYFGFNYFNIFIIRGEGEYGYSSNANTCCCVGRSVFLWLFCWSVKRKVWQEKCRNFCTYLNLNVYVSPHNRDYRVGKNCEMAIILD
jgi:hypothetical protein